MRCLIVIPARLASTRLPEKLLRIVGGKTILEHTYAAACRSRVADEVVVAVDDEKLASEVSRFGGRAVMTPVDCASGTDRVACVAREMADVDLLVNVQGDEPEIDAAIIDAVAQQLVNDPQVEMATAATPLREEAALHDPNLVKVVLGQDHRAIYFSRAAVPHARGGINAAQLQAEPPNYWHHVGLYAYRRDFLHWFTAAPPSPLEQLEKLEQLRAIEAGKQIRVAPVKSAAAGIDTQEDLDAFAERFRQSRSR